MKTPQEQIQAGWIDGAVVLGGTRGTDFLREAWGIADRQRKTPMRTDCVFDIASLTKVVGTAPLLALCTEEGLVDFDAPFTEYLPYRGKIPAPVTVRHLATHCSGVQINYPCFPGEHEKMARSILAEDFVRPPGVLYEYTCTGYILLGFLIEAVTGRSLEELAAERIFAPLGMTDTRWGAPPEGALPRTIRTINADPGVISDHGARAMAPRRTGNAGIFSTADDLAKFCRMMLGEGKGLFRSETMELFFRNQAPQGMTARSLGWNLDKTGIPRAFSSATIFHTGWTGQSMWIDPETGRFLLVLTNRFGESSPESCKGRLAIAAEALDTIS